MFKKATGRMVMMAWLLLYVHLSTSLADSRPSSLRHQPRRYHYVRRREVDDRLTKCSQQNITQEAETIQPSERIPLNLTIGILLALKNFGEGKFHAGAFFVALDDLHAYAKEKGFPVTFNWVMRDTTNRKNIAAMEMLDLYINKNVSAFIGPSVFCMNVVSMVTGMRRPLITYDCQDGESDGFDLMVNIEARFHYVSRSILSLMTHFKWKSFWIVSGQSEKWAEIVEQIKSHLEIVNITINDEDIGDNLDVFMPEFSDDIFLKIIEKSMTKTRVYLFLGDQESLAVFMHTLYDKAGEDNFGRYAVISVDEGLTNFSNSSLFYMPIIDRDKHVSESLVRRYLQSFRNLLVISRAKRVSNKLEFSNKVKEKNQLPPIEIHKSTKINDKNTYKVTSLAYQLYDATMIYGKAVMSLMATPGKDPENADDVIERLRCHYHDSILGEKIWIHENGQSENSFVVLGVKLAEDGLTGKLDVVGTFTKKDYEKIPEYKPTRDASWYDGHAPESDPECGFDDEYCREEEDNDIIIAVSVAVPISVFLIVVVVLFFGIRHCVYEKKLDKLAWKIEREEIQLLNEGQFRVMTTPARKWKKSSMNGTHYSHLLMKTDSESDISHKDNGSDFIPIGFYRGAYVAIKLLTRKHLELTRVLKKQMQLRKELTHENINRFIGACFEPPKVYIVTQYCNRKSLEDILRNEYAHLDNMFVTSLVQDLIRGMTFIHESQFGYHGNLKSSNCLVDSRWTLKISDFGFSALGPPAFINFDDENSFKSLLWTAPELLRKRRTSSTSGGHQNQQQHHHLLHSTSSGSVNNSYNYSKSHHFYNNSNFSKSHHQVLESQKGDVYSFAIILYELYGRAGPWGQVKMSPKEIIQTLIHPGTAGARPDTSELNCDQNVINLIKDCWQQEFTHRPDFKGGIRAQFKPIQQGFLKSNIFDNMLAMMEKYANNLEAIVAERTELLRQEKRMTENLLLRMLPRSVAEKLKRGHRVEPEQYEQVSIYFSDIVGFTQLSASSTPMEVVDLLNDLYTCFDSIIEEFDVYKVETIGDAYMVVSGLPIRNGDRHAGEIASMALELLGAIKQKKFKIQSTTNHMLQIRIGIHSGPCCAGVVGLKMPRYCLFGDTVNTANRMESTGEAQKIHCSADCKKILDKLGGYTLDERGYTEMKGKGKLLTYFLQAEDLKHRQKRISQYKKMGNDGRCVSTSNLDYTGKIVMGKYPRLQFPRLTANNLDSTGADRTSWSSSLNTSLDSAWSEPVDPASHRFSQFHQHCLSPSTPGNPQGEYVSSTLPRVCGLRFNSHMSPIAEDPSPGNEVTAVEKNTPVPNSTYLDSSSETDPLLADTKQWVNSLPTDSLQALLAGQSGDQTLIQHSDYLAQNGIIEWVDGQRGFDPYLPGNDHGDFFHFRPNSGVSSITDSDILARNSFNVSTVRDSNCSDLKDQSMHVSDFPDKNIQDSDIPVRNIQVSDIAVRNTEVSDITNRDTTT